MMTAAFGLGMRDARSGKFDPDQDGVRQDIRRQWDYERGWAFAKRTGLSGVRKVNPRRVLRDDVLIFTRHYRSETNPNGTIL